MELIEWRDEYNLGDLLIDTHHRIFFEIVRNLANTKQDNGQRHETSEVLQFLFDYIAMHFSAEEQLMESIGYPNLETHQKTHANFTRRIESINEKLLQDPSGFTLEELLGIAQSWFLKHILEEDMKYKKWVPEAQE